VHEQDEGTCARFHAVDAVPADTHDV